VVEYEIYNDIKIMKTNKSKQKKYDEQYTAIICVNILVLQLSDTDKNAICPRVLTSESTVTECYNKETFLPTGFYKLIT